MIAAVRAMGKRLALLSTVLCLAVAGTAGIATADSTPNGPPDGVAVLSPLEDQTIPSAPVSVSVGFSTAVQPGSFAADLNGLDVTARFTVGAGRATASLAETDGIRISTDKNRQSNTLQVWMTGADDPTHRYHDRRAFVVKNIGLPAPVSGIITPDGGTLVSPGVGQVTFPAGAFLTDTTVELSVSRDPGIQQLFDDTAVPMFNAANRLGYEIRVTTGTVQPLLDPQVTLTLPDSFRFDVTAGSEVRMLAEDYWDDSDDPLDTEALDTLELLPDRFQASDLQITATMPVYFFTDSLRTDGVFELTTLAATTPTAPLSAASTNTVQYVPAGVSSTGDDAQVSTFATLATTAAGTCKGSSLAPPLNGPLIEKSQFGPRYHPLLKKWTDHGGTDLAAANGTPVLAMADGVVDPLRPYQMKGKAGWGWYITITGTDGSKTLYAHLQDGSRIRGGTVVHAGDQIALSDSSGGVTGPHLHIQYAPNGQIYDKSSNIDPFPCIGRNVIGSITVRDNGNLADDAFAVAIDGHVVCTTQLGASNTCAAGALRAGTHTLSLTVVAAPDNVGTYEIILSDGLTFSDGSTEQSGVAPQGASVAYSITVPSS